MSAREGALDREPTLQPPQRDASQRPQQSPSTSHVLEWAVFDPPCGRSPRGFLMSPYDWRFTLFRYPLLFLSNGRFSRKNASLYRSDNAGPLQQQSSDDASAKLVFLGDMMPTSTGAPPTADPPLIQLCSEADLVLINCESPVTRGETTRNGLSFSISPRFVADCLSNLGIDASRAMFTVADNHAGDKGAEGIGETVSNIEGLGATVLGSAVQGKGLLAKVRIRSINATIGIVSWSRWMNSNAARRHFPIWRAEDVAAHDWATLREEHSIDALIGFPHWDFEQSYIPDESTTILANHLVGKGAFDAIIGHGSHVCQPVQVSGEGGLCAYSIGNLCSTKGGWHTRMGMAFELRLNAEGKLTSYAAHPFIQRPGGRTNAIRLESFDVNAPSSRDYRFVRRWRHLFPAPPRDDLSLASAGDVLVFSARTMASRLTKAVTRSPYSHVAMIAPDHSGKLIVYEATKNSDKTPDVTYGDEEYVGVHSFDIATRVRDFTGDCWLLRQKQPLSVPQVAALSAFCQRHLEKKTPFDYSQLVTAGIDDPFGIFESKPDAERLFCSEFVCFALQEAGLFSGNPSEMTPLDAVNLPCFSTPLLVKRLD